MQMVMRADSRRPWRSRLPAFALKLLIGVPSGDLRGPASQLAGRSGWVMSLSVAGYTIPSFVLGLVLVLVFAVRPGVAAQRWQRHLAAMRCCRWSPSAWAGRAVLARFTRSAMLEVMGQPYIRTASAKGLLLAPGGTRPRACPMRRCRPITVVGFHGGHV